MGARTREVDGNETADKLTKQSLSHPFIGPEPVLGIPAEVARGVIMGWTSSNMSFGSPFMDKVRLRAFVRDALAKELRNC
jgi:hypothetical protein